MRPDFDLKNFIWSVVVTLIILAGFAAFMFTPATGKENDCVVKRTTVVEVFSKQQNSFSLTGNISKNDILELQKTFLDLSGGEKKHNFDDIDNTGLMYTSKTSGFLPLVRNNISPGDRILITFKDDCLYMPIKIGKDFYRKLIETIYGKSA